MGIVHGVLSQPQDFLPSWALVLTKNEQLQGWFGPNDMCIWLQIAAEAFQSPNWFMSKVYKAWDGYRIHIFHPNTLFSAQPTPKFGQKWTVWGLHWPKSHVWMIVDCFRSIPKSRWVHKYWLWSLWWESHMSFYDNHNIFYQVETLSFGKKRAARGLIWLKSHVCMVADSCRSIPKSKLPHKQ